MEDLKEESTELSDKKRVILQNALELVFYVVFAVLFITLVPKYVMERVSVDGSSMCETLHDRDQLIAEKITVRHNRLKRYDIIYFHPNGNTECEPYIKRIIGLPGDKVQILDSVIYINDYPLSEQYAAEPGFESGRAEQPIYLGSDEYFVLGDNRNHSSDSRTAYVGSVKQEDIVGKAIFRIWPLKSFGKID